MAFSINGRIYHSSLGLALIVLGPAGRGQLRQGLGSHDIFTIKSSASLGTLFFHKYLGNDILLDIYTNKTRLRAQSRSHVSDIRDSEEIVRTGHGAMCV